MNTQSTNFIKLLIVDDHVLFREGLVTLLDSQPDFTVVGQAGSVSMAIEKAEELCPDLILMDINLPDGRGTDAVREILARSPNTKIVMLTIYESDELLLSALRQGARGYMLKGRPFSDLLASLRALGRGEAALSRSQVTLILNEFSRAGVTGALINNSSFDLTFRELDVLKHLGMGASNREIAESLVIAENTVKGHVHSILKKLDLRNRREAAKFARRQGLVS